MQSEAVFCKKTLWPNKLLELKIRGLSCFNHSWVGPLTPAQFFPSSALTALWSIVKLLCTVFLKRMPSLATLMPFEVSNTSAILPHHEAFKLLPQNNSGNWIGLPMQANNKKFKGFWWTKGIFQIVHFEKCYFENKKMASEILTVFDVWLRNIRVDLTDNIIIEKATLRQKTQYPNKSTADRPRHLSWTSFCPIAHQRFTKEVSYTMEQDRQTYMLEVRNLVRGLKLSGYVNC